MQRTLLKFIPSLILVGGLFTSLLQLKRVLHVSTGKYTSCRCCSHSCGGTFSDFICFQPNHPAQRMVRKTRQPFPLLMCIVLASCPQGKRAMVEVELGEVQCGMGGSPNTQCLPLRMCAKAALVAGADRTCLGAPPEVWREVCGSAVLGSLQLRTAGHRQRAPCRQGSWDCSRAVGHSLSFWW